MDVVEWSRALDVRLSEWCCSVTMVWVQIPSREEQKFDSDKQRSTKHIYKTKDRVTRTPLKTGGELRYSGRISSSCSTSGTRRVNLVTNPVISRE